MKAENSVKIQFDSLSANEAFARGAVGSYRARNAAAAPRAKASLALRESNWIFTLFSAFISYPS